MAEIITEEDRSNLEELAKKLLNYAKENGTKDNTTILIIELRETKE